jgi:hypothetical protein
MASFESRTLETTRRANFHPKSRESLSLSRGSQTFPTQRRRMALRRRRFPLHFESQRAEVPALSLGTIALSHPKRGGGKPYNSLPKPFRDSPCNGLEVRRTRDFEMTKH